MRIFSSAPIILLCHSGGSNKVEYADIAPKLNAKGFNALAIDQRSGGTFAGHENETFQRAKAEGRGTEFVDARQDIEAEAITDVLLSEVELSEFQAHHTPSFEGFHGVRTLWEGQRGANDYWKAVDDFLKKLFLYQ